MPSISIQPNRAYQNIPDVSDDLASQKIALQTIKGALQTHERRDGNYLQSFIRFEELVELGIIDATGEFILDLAGSGGAVALDDLTDVTIGALVDNNILGYDTGSAMWTSQSAGSLNLSVIGHAHVLSDITDLASLELGDLSDVTLTGAQDNDLLFRSGGNWLPTMGGVQWDGADLFIPTGDINFYGPLDAVSQRIRQGFPGANDLTIGAGAGDIYLDATGDVRLASLANFILENTASINWVDSGDTSRVLLEFISTGSGTGVDPDFTNVSLLANFDGADGATTYIEASNNTFVATFVNNAEIDTAQSVFGPSSVYFQTTNGNYITFPSDAAWDLGNDDFTIEFRIRWDTVAPTTTFGMLGHFQNTAANQGWHVSFTSSPQEAGFFWSDDGTIDTFFLRNAWAPAADTWYCFAVVRSGLNLYMFVDGVQIGVTRNMETESLPAIAGPGGANIFNANQPLRVGEIDHSGVPIGVNGWIDELRITKGVARYTAGYTCASAPFGALSSLFIVGDPAYPTDIDGSRIGIKNLIGISWEDSVGSGTEMLVLRDIDTIDGNFDSVVLLLPFEGADASTATSDLSGSAHAITFVGNAQIDTSQANNQTSALLLDGTGDWVTAPDSTDWHFSSEDFTIDIAVRFNLVATSTFASHYNPNTSDRAWALGYSTVDGLRFIYTEDGVSITAANRAWIALPNIWYEVRVSRVGTDLYLFIDGVLQGVAHNIGTAVVYDSPHVLTIGALGNSGVPSGTFNGWIDDLRITKGIGRSSSTYAPPTGEWPIEFGFPGFVMGNEGYLSAILGTDLQILPTSTLRGAVSMLSTLDVDGDSTFGSGVTIQGPTNVGSALFTHDDTDFFTSFTNTRYWSVTGVGLDVQRVSGSTGMFIGGTTPGTDEPMLHFYDIGNVANSRVMFFTEDMGKGLAAGFYFDTHAILVTPNNEMSWGHTSTGDILTFHEDNRAIIHKPLFFDERATAVSDMVAKGQLWVRNDSPNILMFTDGAGTAFEVSVSTPTSTTAALEAIADAINTSASKLAGTVLFNTTTSQPVWAIGSADGDVWVDATGATAHTPV